MAKFKLDENLPREVTQLLLDAGHDAISVIDQSLGGQPDPTIGAVCRSEARTIVTLDLDFADIRAYPPKDYPGIIVLRLGKLDKPHVLAVLRILIPLLERESPEKRLWIVDEARVRIRE